MKIFVERMAILQITRISFLAFVFSGHWVSAQVQSSAYHAMVSTLLTHSVPEVSVQDLKKMDHPVLLDAREPGEFTVSHIAHAVNVGYEKFDLQSVKSIPKNKKIVVYCSVGYRSEKIAEKLKAEGYIQVHNLYGGLFEWINQGNEVVDKNERPTTAVHGYSKIWSVWLTKGNTVYK